MLIILLIVVVVATAALTASGDHEADAEQPRATSAGEGHEPDAGPDPTLDRPAGPSAEGNMGPEPGVTHPDDQQDFGAGDGPDAAGHGPR